MIIMRYKKNGWNGKCVETEIPNEYKLYLTKNEFYFIARGYHRNSEVNMIYKCEDSINNNVIQDTCKFSIPKDIKSEVQKHIIEQFIMHITNKFPREVV